MYGVHGVYGLFDSFALLVLHVSLFPFVHTALPLFAHVFVPPF